MIISGSHRGTKCQTAVGSLHGLWPRRFRRNIVILQSPSALIFPAWALVQCIQIKCGHLQALNHNWRWSLILYQFTFFTGNSKDESGTFILASCYLKWAASLFHLNILKSCAISDLPHTVRIRTKILSRDR